MITLRNCFLLVLLVMSTGCSGDGDGKPKPIPSLADQEAKIRANPHLSPESKERALAGLRHSAEIARQHSEGQHAVQEPVKASK